MSSISPKPATEGRIVHIHAPGVEHCQPAIVVRAWGDGTGSLNLQVFRDGSNDHEGPSIAIADRSAAIRWATSVAYSEERTEGTSQTWHWPETVS